MAFAAVLAVTGCASPVSTIEGQPAPSAGAQPGAGPTFGTLVSSVEHSPAEAAAGVTAAMVELSWAQAEPGPGRFDDAYLRSVRAKADALRATGRSITLGLGLHYTPQWLLAAPDARFVDENGNVSDELNLVFNQSARTAAEAYLAKVASVIGIDTIDAVRITSGGVAEVLYPGGRGYWAFDNNAQNGPDLPPTIQPNPLPGWRPGQPGVDAEQVKAWADWYIGGLADVVSWQVATLSQLGFRGAYEVLTPGVGVLPQQYADAINGGLPNGLLGTGAAWQQFYAALPERSDQIVYVSSVADGSGGDDGCEPGDVTVPTDSPVVASWSATRWLSRVAAEHGYAVAGENPGWNQSGALDARYVDTSASGMMAAAVRQARSCGFRTFYWAHDQQLWDGTVPFADYARLVDS